MSTEEQEIAALSLIKTIARLDSADEGYDDPDDAQETLNSLIAEARAILAAS